MNHAPFAYTVGVGVLGMSVAHRVSRAAPFWKTAGFNVHLKRSAQWRNGVACGYGLGVNLAIRGTRPDAPICSVMQANALVAPRQRSAATPVKSGASVRSVASFLKSRASST
jgi:hypothetical protein